MQVLTELGAVGQAGETIVVGQELQLLFGFLAGGQVGHHPHIADHPFLLVTDGAHLQPFGEDFAVAAAFADFPFPEATFLQGSGNAQVGVPVGLSLLFFEDAAANDQGLGIAGDLFKAGVHGEETELLIKDEDAFRGVFEHGGGQALLFLGLAVIGDVPAGADHAGGAAVAAAGYHPAFILNPAPAAVCVA